jgi:hypothetical protein
MWIEVNVDVETPLRNDPVPDGTAAMMEQHDGHGVTSAAALLEACQAVVEAT